MLADQFGDLAQQGDLPVEVGAQVGAFYLADVDAGGPRLPAGEGWVFVIAGLQHIAPFRNAVAVPVVIVPEPGLQVPHQRAEYASQILQVPGVLIDLPGQADEKRGGGQSAVLSAQPDLVVDKAVFRLPVNEVVQQRFGRFRVFRQVIVRQMPGFDRGLAAPQVVVFGSTALLGIALIGQAGGNKRGMLEVLAG